MITWFLLGGFIGTVLGMGSVVAIIIHLDRDYDREVFVKKLIEKEGWEGARWELEFAYGVKYMRIWRKLRKEHVNNGIKQNR